MKHWGFAVLTILTILLFTACGQRTPAPITVVSSAQAPVKEVEVARLWNDPAGIRVVVRGELADGCAKLKPEVIQHGGTLFAVILPTERVSQRDCAPGPVSFERVIALDVSGLAAGTYKVMVNGVSETFELSGPPVTATPAPVAQVEKEPTGTPAQEVSAGQVEARPGQGSEPAKAPDEEPVNKPVVEPVVDPVIPNTAVDTMSGGQGSVECVNKAAFYDDVTVPDGTIFDPGQAFTKTWRVRNAGTCTWQGYQLVFVSGERLASVETQPLSKTVAPGELVDISIQMTAPVGPGGYVSQWQLGTPDGARFGMGAAGNGPLWAKIGVRTLNPNSGTFEGSGDSGSPSNPQAACSWLPNASYEAQVLGLINQERLARELAPLTLDTALSAVSRGHSQDMACNNFVEHYGSDGSNYISRVQAANIRFRSTSENIYAGNPAYGGDPVAAVTWWMNSKIHRDAILNPRFKMVGIGYAYYEGSNYKGYFTLNFTEP